MLVRLASASLACAICLLALASAPAHARAQDAPEGKRAPAVPDLPPAPELSPAVTPPQDKSYEGMGVGWGMPNEVCYKLKSEDYQDLFAKLPVSEEAVITEKPEPDLTDEARRNGTRGVVRLGLALSKKGRVAAVWVFEGQPDGLTERAIAAACRIKFRPATGNGQPVTSRVTLEYNFGGNKGAQSGNPARPAPGTPAEPPGGGGPVVRFRRKLDGGMLVARGGDPKRVFPEDETSPPDYNKIFRAAEVSPKAMITEKPEPGFTEEARRNATFGVVRMRLVLAGDGSVKLITVIDGLPDGLTERAVAAARGIRFRPALRNDRPVSQLVTIEYNFRLDDEDGLERKAVILEQPAPVYTDEARRRGVAGKVSVELALWEDGTVGARLVEGLPHGLGEEAVKAARRIKFSPAEHKGRKVSVVRRVEYRFPPE